MMMMMMMMMMIMHLNSDKYPACQLLNGTVFVIDREFVKLTEQRSVTAMSHGSLSLENIFGNTFSHKLKICF